MGVRLLLLGIGLGSLAAHAVPQIPPKSLPVTIVKTEIAIPNSVNSEGAPIENVRAFAPTATVHFPVAPQDLERFNLRIQPVLEMGEEKVELPWMSASSIIDYVNRIPTNAQVNVIQTEDGAWAKAVPLGLVVDLATEKMTAAYQFLEWRLSQNNMGNPDAAVVQIPIDQVGDRVLTRAPKLQLPEKWQDQQFFLNFTGDKLIRVVVLAFEGAPNNGHQPGPLAPYIPSYKNRDHSAIVMVRSQLENMDKREVGIFRIPVGLIRTVSKVDLEAIAPRTPTIDQSVAWLRVAQIGNYKFDGMQDSVEERFLELKADAAKHFATAAEFDLTPECSALIVRANEQKDEAAQ